VITLVVNAAHPHDLAQVIDVEGRAEFPPQRSEVVGRGIDGRVWGGAKGASEGPGTMGEDAITHHLPTVIDRPRLRAAEPE
jgi:hypothetical protein